MMVRHTPLGPAGRSLLRSPWGAAAVLATLAVLVLGLLPAPASAQPVVTDLQPASGTPGTQIHIYGSGFSTTGDNVVEFAGTSATINGATNNILSVTIPPSLSGVVPVDISSNGGSSFTTAPERVSVVTGGTGAFAPDSSLGTIVASDVARGDVDGDGDLDLLVTGTNEGSAVTQLYVNNGSGSFSEASSTGLPDLRESTVDLGDADNDGDLDVLFTGVNSSENAVTSLYTKDDNALSYTEATGLTGVENGGADLGDVDNDGDLDIVLAGNNNESAETFLYTNRLVEEGSLDFTQATVSLTGTTSSTVDIADVNNDGALDLVITGEEDDGTTSSTLYMNDGGGTSFTSTSLSPAVQDGAVDVGDVNNDGALDLVVSGNTGTGLEATLLLNDSSNPGSFTPAQSLKGIINGSAAFGDVNADGNLDLLLTGRDFSDSPENTIVYTGNGSSSSPFSATRAGLADVGRSAAVLGDFNGDGRLAPFIAGFGASRPSATLYRPVLAFTNSAPLSDTPSAPLSSNIGLGFNAPVVALTGLADSIQVTGSQSGALGGTVGGAGTDSLVYDPTQAFAPGERVSVALRPGIESAGGLSLFRPDGFRFRAAAPTGPAAFPLRRVVSDSETGAREVAAGFLTGNGHLDLVVTASGDDEITLYEGNGDGSFATGTPIASGVQYARALALADVTGDGLLDVIVGEGAQGTNTGSGDQVRLYENQGGGSFGSTQTVAGSSVIDDVRALATADLDRDGHQDIVSVSANNNRVNAHFNDGQGDSFTTTPIDQGAGSPRAVTLADLDRNGTLDVVVGSADNDIIVWYANQGGGTFDSPQPLDAAVNPRSLRTANVDGDEFLEIVAAERGDDGTADDGAVAVYKRSPFGWDKNRIATTDSVLTAVPADVNGNGKVDIVAGSVDGDSLVWYENTSSEGFPSFEQGQTFGTGRPNVQDVVAADVDGDGSLDPVTASTDADQVALYPNVEPLTGTGTTPTPNAVGVDTSLSSVEFEFNKALDGSSVSTSSVVLNGDQSGRIGTASVGVFNNTLQIDPASSFQPGETVTVSVLADSVADTDGVPLDSTETVSFTATTASGGSIFSALTTALPNVSESAVDWGDFDNDGDLDLVIAGDSAGTTNRKTAIYENDVENSNGFSRLGAGLTAVDGGDVAWSDYDGDGNLDVIVTGQTGSGGTTDMYEGDGTGTFSGPIGAGLPDVYNSSVDWADYNGDGRLDLVLSGQSTDGDTTQVYRNEGGSFASVNAGLVNIEKGEVDWGDYNSNGRPDLVVAGTDGSARYATVYRNEGDGTFTDVADLTGVSNAAARWGDYNNDGRLDLAISGQDGTDSRSTTIYRNEGGGTFSPVSAGLTGLQDGSVDWADYDGDGRLDLAVMGDSTGGGANGTKIYRNEGGGTFSALGAGLLGVRQGDLAWADFDGDGVLDLVASGLGGEALPTTALYRQTEALRVTGTTPSRNATSVDTSLPDIEVTFNKTPNTDSVTAGDLRVVGTQTGPIPEADDSVGVSSTTLTYELGRSFQPGETITVSLLADSVVATDGTALPTTEAVQFTAETAQGPLAFPSDQLLGTSSPVDVELAHINNDDSLDVVVALQDTALAWYEGGTTLSERIVNTESDIEAVETADIDGDGNLDIITDANRWYKNNGTGSFADQGAFDTEVGTEMVTADLDGDGRPDLLANQKVNGTVVWYRNTGGGFGTANSIASDVDFPNLAAADLDGNGTLDPVVTSNDTVFWHPSNGDGRFQDRTVVAIGNNGNINAVSTANVNGDGAADVVFADADRAYVYSNDGSGTFSQEDAFTGDILDVALADVNGDATPDIIRAPFSPGQNIDWYENDGTGGVSGPTVIWDNVPASVDDIAVGDLDADGDLDVVGASSGADALALSRNTTIAPQVVTEPASDTTDSSFTAEAAVNPGGAETTVTFQYGTTTPLGSDTTVTATTSLTGDDTTAVSATIGGLDPATTYDYRVAASNSVGSTTGASRSVTTDVAPPSTVDDAVTTPEDTPVAIDVLSNDTVIAPLDTSTLTVQTAPPLGSTSVDSSTGTITYTPAPDSSGTVQFGYTIADDSGNVSNEATVVVTVAPVNDPPTATPDTFTTADGQTLSVAAPGLLGNDSDPEGDALTVTGTAQAPVHGDATLQADGAFTYTPNDGYVGPDSLAYEVADANGATSTGTVRLSVREATLQAGTDTSRFAPRRTTQTGPGTSITVSNAGAVSLTNITASIRGPDAADFTIADVDGTGPLAPGASRTYTLTFTPSASGLRTAALELTAAEEDTVRTIALRGRGVEVALRAGPVALGAEAEVALSIAGGFSPTDGRRLFFRKSGTNTYRDTAFTVGPNDSLRAPIPQDIVTPRGVDYYITLTADSSTLTIPAGGPAAASTQPRHLPVTFESLSPPSPVRTALFQPETYRMVSVPAVPQNGIKAALKSAYGGSYAPNRWRLERWDASERTYRGYPDIDSLRPGDGFWLTTRAGTGVTLPPGRTLPADTARTIRLQAGWNQIGTPFGFAVPWDTIQAASPIDTTQLDGPVGYADSTFQLGRAALAPWKGYFVYNATGRPDTLVVPPVGASAATKAGGATPRPEAQLVDARLPGTRAPSSTEDKSTSSASNGRYTLRVEALSASGSAQAHLGLWPGAKAGRGPYDHAQPPAIGGGLRLSALQTVHGRTVPHAFSMKPPRAEAASGGRHWTLRLCAPGADGTRRAKLRLRDRGALPEGYQRYLLDLTAGRRIAPGAELSVESDEPRRLKVIVGTRRYAEKNNEGVSLESLQTALRGNYPNPFTEQTTVEYVLSEEQDVTIEVYDVLGRRVRTLVDGRQELGVHRTSLEADQMGSGVYFLRLRAGDASDTKKVVLVK